MRTEALRAVGGYPEWLRVGEEYTLYIRLRRAGWHFAYDDRRTATYRWPEPGRGATFNVRRSSRQEVKQFLVLALSSPPDLALYNGLWLRLVHLLTTHVPATVSIAHRLRAAGRAIRPGARSGRRGPYPPAPVRRSARVGEEAGQARARRLERAAARSLQAGFDQPIAQRRVLGDPLQRARRGARVARLHQQRRALGRRRNAADGGRDGRQPRRERLDQHLRKALGQRYVQEHVAAAIEVEQATVDRHVAEQLDDVEQSALGQALAQRLAQRPVAADE